MKTHTRTLVCYSAERTSTHNDTLATRKTRVLPATRFGEAVCSQLLGALAVCCSVLQRVAVCCSVLQRVAACCSVVQLLGTVIYGSFADMWDFFVEM